MQKSQPLRIAIIGVGAIADVIAKALSEIDDAKLIAASCRTREKGEKFIQRWGGAWSGDVQQLLADHKPDVAIVTTPSAAHLQPALACIERGVHVLVEKPIEVTTARASQLIDAAKRNNVRVGGIFPQRFNPVNALLRETAAAGRFGNLAAIHAIVPWWRDDAYYAPNRWQGKAALDGGGALMNQAIHTVDLMQWIVGEEVTEVFAFTAKRGHDEKLIEVEDTAAAIMRFKSGAIGQILAATSMYPGQQRRLQISGRDGSAEVVEDQLVHFAFRQPLPEDDNSRQRLSKPTQHAGGASNPMAIDYVPHKRNIEDFLSALRTGRDPMLTGEEALKAVRIVEACYESARTNKPIPLA